MEALMYVNGHCGRADLGLDIAINIRKRGWSQASKERLAVAYSQGKIQKINRRGDKYSPKLGDVLNIALERNIESELGALIEDKSKRNSNRIDKIRLQFKSK